MLLRTLWQMLKKWKPIEMLKKQRERPIIWRDRKIKLQSRNYNQVSKYIHIYKFFIITFFLFFYKYYNINQRPEFSNLQSQPKDPIEGTGSIWNQSSGEGISNPSSNQSQISPIMAHISGKDTMHQKTGTSLTCNGWWDDNCNSFVPNFKGCNEVIFKIKTKIYI